ncbi:hypothetical protein D5086_015514 [Populus alba]|uniref:Uncharacterized protein n=1 Tax=Populus alba TaxID=43335 RepID=A0ACC4BSM6_POPAL
MGQETRKLLDEYEVSDILGRGGFSVVRRGIMKTSGDRRQVAIKTLKRLGPSGIPRSRGDDQNGVHLVLELCSGGELFDRIVARDKYSEREAAAVVRQIAEGLGALHRANIVHRDLKPENCLFLNENDDSTLKIMDFGLSSVEEFTDPVVGLFGSIDYVSPEALSQGRISSKTDMWSLGVILYILLSGYPPFIAQSNRQTEQVILAGDFSFYEKTWKNITSSAKQLITDLNHPWVRGFCRRQMDPEIVSRLQSFNARRKFCAAAIASALPEDCLPADITEPGKLDEIFDRMDANSDGKVTFDEFKAAMQRDSSL